MTKWTRNRGDRSLGGVTEHVHGRPSPCPQHRRRCPRLGSAFYAWPRRVSTRGRPGRSRGLHVEFIPWGPSWLCQHPVSLQVQLVCFPLWSLQLASGSIPARGKARVSSPPSCALRWRSPSSLAVILGTPGPIQLLQPAAGRGAGLRSCVRTSLGESRCLQRMRVCLMEKTPSQRLRGVAGVGNGARLVCKRQVISRNAARSWAAAFLTAQMLSTSHLQRELGR